MPSEDVMIGFALGIVSQNAGEWLVHKYILHNRGKKKTSFWSFHFHEHHRASRTNDMVDGDYKRPLHSGWNAQAKEGVALALATVVFWPLFPVAPGWVAGVTYGNLRYYRVHKKAHLDPEWAREHLPWHYDHHMGLDQDANWCVSRPWFDVVMGTRQPYLGTEREQSDRKKRQERLAKQQAQPPAARPASRAAASRAAASRPAAVAAPA